MGQGIFFARQHRKLRAPRQVYVTLLKTMIFCPIYFPSSLPGCIMFLMCGSPHSAHQTFSSHPRWPTPKMNALIAFKSLWVVISVFVFSLIFFPAGEGWTVQETDNISTIAQNFISCAKMFDSSMHVVKCTFTWLQVRYYSTGSIRVYLHKKKKINCPSHVIYLARLTSLWAYNRAAGREK